MNGTARRAFFLLTLFFLLGQSAPAASLVPAARIVRTEGEVSVRYAGTDDFVSVWRHEKVGPGDTISTGPDGFVEMRFSDGTCVVLGPSGSLTVTGVTPRRVTGGGDGREKILLDTKIALGSGELRAAVGPGAHFVMSAGAVLMAAAPETGADFTCAADIFALGYYLRVDAGCVFLPRIDSAALPVCAGGRVKVGIFPDGPIAPLIDDPYGVLTALDFAGEPPAIIEREDVVTGITIDGRQINGRGGLFRIPSGIAGKQKTVTIGGTAPGGRAVLISRDNGASWVTVAPDRDGRWRYPVGPVPADGYTLIIKTIYTGFPPPDLTAAAEGTLAGTSTEAPAAKEEKIDPDAVASRFVQSFSGALSRGDTGALSALISPDYNGVAGGAGRSALLRGVSEFFRAGGTLAVSAYAGGASLAQDTVIVTMSFSSRVNGAPKTGNVKLWLTSDGQLIHAEGEWVL